jgi:hypothetical protein
MGEVSDISGDVDNEGWRKTNILWMGNQIAGREINQKRKKHMKSRVLIPALSGRPFAVKIS